MNNIVMTEFKDMRFMKVFYELEGVIVGMDVFQLKDDQIIQLSPGVLTPKEEGQIQSGVYDRAPNAEEFLLVQDIFKRRLEYALSKTVEYVSHMDGMVLLGLYEIAGRFFAYTKQENLRFPRLAEVWLSASDIPIILEEVPKEFLPFVCEKIAPHALDKKNKGMTLQIGNGLFVRLRRQSATAFATVVVLEFSESGVVEKVSAPLGFAMTFQNEAWMVLPESKEFEAKIQEEMRKSFDHVNNELALALNDENK